MIGEVYPINALVSDHEVNNMSSDNTNNQENEQDLIFTSSDEATINFASLKSYRIDFDKVNTLEDVIKILKAMDLHIMDDGSDRFEPIRDILTERTGKDVTV